MDASTQPQSHAAMGVGPATLAADTLELLQSAEDTPSTAGSKPPTFDFGPPIIGGLDLEDLAATMNPEGLSEDPPSTTGRHALGRILCTLAGTAKPSASGGPFTKEEEEEIAFFGHTANN